jgi:hypothetical protein
MLEKSAESLEQRRTRYLQCAAEAQEFGLKCPSLAAREAYLRLARSWRALAEDIKTIGEEPH